jgi:serine protease Do
MNLSLAESQLQAVGSLPPLDGDARMVWDTLGLNLSQEPHATFERRNTRYRGGMHVDGVRPNSPAAEEGILPGDILVGMHKWETASPQDIQYIITRPNLTQMKMKFYVLRGQNTLFGHLDMAAKPSSTVRH